ncbi:SsrA-binding protein [Patescibacteria group bacterium]|nr:SsrA-binding protein [Patescibacteria group bacterium]
MKSVKTSNIDLRNAIVKLDHDTKELYITNMDIPLYSKTNPESVAGYEPKGRRKLLVNKKELAKIAASTTKTGLTIVPLAVRENLRRMIKVKIGIGKLRRQVEKKQLIKERDTARLAEKEIKHLRI